MKRILLFLIVLPCLLASSAADTAEGFSIIPNVHGTLRTRYEMATGNGYAGDERFQVRNARLTVDGHLAPPVSYFIQADLCDRGKVKILDAWGRIDFSQRFNVQAGQFRMPFGTDVYRAPFNYIFNNRSFVGKQMCNYRGVGARVAWMPVKTLTLETGAYNPTSMADHEVWVRHLAYAAKVLWRVSDFSFSTGLLSLRPDGTRVNLTGASAGWQSGRWQTEAEYMIKHYTRSDLADTHAWVIWGNYAMPVSLGVFNEASFQARFDGLTDHSTGFHDNDGRLIVTDPSRTRLTLGSTITYRYKRVHADIRLNYEAYFYRHDVIPSSPTEASKVSAELVIRF
ncbi:MAG: OprO/OprP family phosphate-selective porin [Duncaniella sp.]|nr:OprO/OprP family phosphate-selective porin [Duncaniella sp.]